LTPEAKLTAAVIRLLKRHKAAGVPIWWLKIAGSPMQRRGVPDLLIVLDGRAIVIEVKAPGGKATPLQTIRIEQARAAGAVACVCRTVEEVKANLTGAIRSWRSESKAK
jgi:hypothetical protein